jgi:hypothetical protein
MTSDKPQIRVTVAQRNRLHDLKGPGESYADVVGDLLDAVDDDFRAAQAES